MKLTIERNSLVKALDRVAKIVDRKTTIPVLANLLLTAKDGALTLTGTDLDLSVETHCSADIFEPGTLTVSAGLLRDIARKWPEGCQVSFETASETSVTLKSGRSRFSLSTLPAEDFPSVMAFEPKASFKLQAKNLIALLTSVAFAISTEETRYYLNGIFLHAMEKDGGKVLRAVATDGHRLGRMEMPAPDFGGGEMPSIIVPTKAVHEICRLAQGQCEEDQGEVAVEMSETKIKIAAGDTVLISKLIDGTFPDYVRVIPAGNQKRATIDRVPFMNAADRVSTISSERGRAVKLEFEHGLLKLSVQNPDHGEAAEEVEADYNDDPLPIGFNARYLHDILSSIDTPNVLVSLNDPGSPTLFSAHDGAPLLIVLMPMRV